MEPDAESGKHVRMLVGEPLRPVELGKDRLSPAKQIFVVHGPILSRVAPGVERAQRATNRPAPYPITSAARRASSSGGTSSTRVDTFQRWPNGSSN